jgi:serine/threonine protein kinase
MKTEVAIKEINILRKLNHKNIIKLVDAKKTPQNIYLIMEFCNEGNLEKLI